MNNKAVDNKNIIQNKALMEFINEMTTIRKDLGISQRKLRSLTGIAQPKICQLETGKNNNPSVNTLQKIANALGKELVIKLV